MEKNYKSFPLEEYALERGHIQCPHRWKNFRFSSTSCIQPF